MAGKIIADQIEGTTTTEIVDGAIVTIPNIIDTKYVVNGSAKAWNCFDEGSSSTLRDSFNVSTITDNSTSNFDTNFINSMSNNDYAFTASNANPNGNNNQIIAGTAVCSKTTGEFGVRSQNYSGSFSDIDGVMTAVFGDLA